MIAAEATRLLTTAAFAMAASAMARSRRSHRQYTVHKSIGRADTHRWVDQNRRIEIVADPHRKIRSEWWLHS